jgi:adenylate cyclase
MAASRNSTRSLADGLVNVLLVLLVSAISVVAIHNVGPLQQASRWLDDFRLAYLTPLAEQSKNVVVLAIDEESLRRMPYRSPIDREFIAKVIEDLNSQHRVRAIGIDLIFDQPTEPENDRLLRSALLESPVPVVVATGESQAGLGHDQLAFQASFLDGIRSGSALLGVEGGSVRTYYPHSPGSGTLSFVNALSLATGIEPQTDAIPILFRRGAIDNSSPIRVFPAHSVSMLPALWLENQIVLIGAVLADRDQHRTPLSILGADNEFTPGVLIHAQVLEQIISGDSLPVLSSFSVNSIVVLAVICGMFLALGPIPTRVRLAVGAALIVSYWIVAFSGGVFWSFPLPLLGPSMAFLLAAAAATAYARQRERRQRIFLHSAFNQYVSAQIIDDILENPEHLRLGGEQRDMSFIFTDITGFSLLAERVTPAELVDLLSDYLDGVVEIALKHRGTIARFVGDGLVIFFGAPLPQDNHRRHAVLCAIELDQFCEQYRQRDKITQHDLGVTRIGVHSGAAVVGNVGGTRRFEYTAHGDVVNTAARLESANRHLGTRVCISKYTADDLQDIDFRPVGSVIVSGKLKPIELVTIWDNIGEPERSDYLAAFALMKSRDPNAMMMWVELAKRLPAEGLILLHLSRLQAGEVGERFTLTEK